MSNFFGSIYSWFQSLYGLNLSYYLWGFDPSTGGYTATNYYNVFGLWTIVLSTVFMVLFYYVFSHPKFSKWWSWLIVLVINSALSFAITFGTLSSKLTNGAIPNELVYQYDQQGNIVATFIDKGICANFGIAACIVAALIFFILSFIFKWWSLDAKHVPFL